MSGGVSCRHGYLLDLDGTLVDTLESNVGAYLQAVGETLPGFSVDCGLLRAHIAAGENYRSFMPVVVPGITLEQVAEVSRRKTACYADYIPLASLNEGLVADARCWKGVPESVIVLVTTAKRANAERVLAYFGLDDLFDFKVFGDGVERLKPAPDIYLHALAEAGLEPGQAEAFEDSQAGVDAATAAGVLVTRVTWTAGA